MSPLGRIAGLFLVIVGGYVLVIATLDLVWVNLGAPPWTYVRNFLVWAILIFGSFQTICIGLMLGFGSHPRVEAIKKRWKQKSTTSKSRTILALICGLIIIWLLFSQLFFSDDFALFTSDYLVSFFIPRLVVGVSSLISGITFPK